MSCLVGFVDHVQGWFLGYGPMMAIFISQFPGSQHSKEYLYAISASTIGPSLVYNHRWFGTGHGIDGIGICSKHLKVLTFLLQQSLKSAIWFSSPYF